jgi:hypothetical protein
MACPLVQYIFKKMDTAVFGVKNKKQYVYRYYCQVEVAIIAFSYSLQPI